MDTININPSSRCSQVVSCQHMTVSQSSNSAGLSVGWGEVVVDAHGGKQTPNERSLVEEYEDDCGTFDLMTGFSATNDTMATTDMSADGERNAAHTAIDSSLDTNDMHHAAKRSRIDKDGFVTPATPDLSIHPHHYLDVETEHKTRSVAESGIPGDSGMDVGRLPPGPEKDVRQVGGQTALSSDSGEMEHNDMDSLTTSCTSLTQLLREFGQRAKMLNTDWSYAFNDSENFESFCVTRLDKMLEDVKLVEADLIEQKEGLRQKLLDLSRTLQLD